jgi:hypothetical protein
MCSVEVYPIDVNPIEAYLVGNGVVAASGNNRYFKWYANFVNTDTDNEALIIST